jgi:hypothetical protein
MTIFCRRRRLDDCTFGSGRFGAKSFDSICIRSSKSISVHLPQCATDVEPLSW